MPNTDFVRNTCENCIFFIDSPLKTVLSPGATAFKLRDGVCRRNAQSLDTTKDYSCGDHILRSTCEQKK